MALDLGALRRENERLSRELNDALETIHTLTVENLETQVQTNDKLLRCQELRHALQRRFDEMVIEIRGMKIKYDTLSDTLSDVDQPKPKASKKNSKKRKRMSSSMRAIIRLRKKEYKDLYGDGPRGRKANDVGWLNAQIKLYHTNVATASV